MFLKCTIAWVKVFLSLARQLKCAVSFNMTFDSTESLLVLVLRSKLARAESSLVFFVF